MSAGQIGLVFTVALKQELPLGWLAERGVAVHAAAALAAGALSGHGQGPASGVLFVITGMGPERSRAAAEWIRDHLEPSFVVNLGTAGGLAPELSVGDWIAPDVVHDGEGRAIRLDPRRPFTIPADIAVREGGALVSVAEPLLDSVPASWADFACVDMEAYAQAEVFASGAGSFHVLKNTSDRPGSGDVKAQFKARLASLRAELEHLLGFLAAPVPGPISAIIPVHDRSERIGPCLESVLAQSEPAAEVIVVDDGSGAATRAVLAGFGDRIRVVELGENRGVAAARNAGVAAATSDWIAFLDSDDHWHPNKLAGQRRFLSAHPYLRALQSEELWIRHGRRVNRKDYHAKPAGWIWSASLVRCLVTASALLVERRLLGELGGFDESLPVCEDYDLWIRMARGHPVGLDPSPTVTKYGGHDDQLSRRYPAMDRFRVLALLAALDRESAAGRCAALVAELEVKLDILAAGSRKRGREDRTAMLAAIRARLAAADYGRPHELSRQEIRDGF